jgi:hypothetical protein
VLKSPYDIKFKIASANGRIDSKVHFGDRGRIRRGERLDEPQGIIPIPAAGRLPTPTTISVVDDVVDAIVATGNTELR